MSIKPNLFSGLLLLLLSMNACTTSQDCQKFRNGKFMMIYKGHTTIITRYGGTQTETLDSAHSTLNVKWVDDCTYILTPTKETLKRRPEIHKDNFVKVEITKVNPNSYMQTSTNNFSDIVITAEIFKIN